MYFNIIPSNTVMHNFKLQFPFSCKMTNPCAGIKSRKTPSCLRQRFSHFHPYDKLCGHSLFRFFGKADISLMGFHDLFGNGKPQTGSLLAVAGSSPTVKGSKITSAISGGIPFPLSEMVILMLFPSAAILKRSMVPS